MAFENLKKAQPQVIKLLENSITKDRLSHAYLFEGEKGTKKYDTALYLAMKLLCTEDDKPCGECHNCRRIKHGTHPNVYTVEPIKNSIRKQQITDLQIEFSKTSVEAGPKVYIIKNIELINPSAANSLLKFLEEPFPETHAILTTENSSRILPTIMSRSQVVQFTPLHNSVIERDLLDEGYPEEVAKIVSHLTNAISEAYDIASRDYFQDIVDGVKEINRLMISKEEPVIIYFDQLSSIIYQDDDANQLFIRTMILYQNDILSYFMGDMNHIVFVNEMETIAALARNKTKNRLIEELESMLELQAKFSSYINRSLAYDNLLLRLERGY